MAAKNAVRHPTGTWPVLGMLLLLLLLAAGLLYVGWDSPASNYEAMMFSGYVAMTFGAIATFATGIGLMLLMYFSNWRGRDF